MDMFEDMRNTLSTKIQGNTFLRTMLSPKNEEEKARRFWTAIGGAQLGAFALQGGLAFPAGVTVALMGYTGFQALHDVANQTEPSVGRKVAREIIRLLFGVKGERNTQFRRRVLDFVLSIGVSVLIGGITVTGLMAGLAAGAGLTLVTTWVPSAEKEWFEDTPEAKAAPTINKLGIAT